MKSRNVTKEKKEYYEKCSKCGTEIKGTSEGMVKWNMKIHQDSKECKK